MRSNQKRKSTRQLIFSFAIDDDSESDSKHDESLPDELADAMLDFWTNEFHFPRFDPKKATFGKHTYKSTSVNLYVPISKQFVLPDYAKLEKFIAYVDDIGPDTYQEGLSGLLYGRFLDLVDVSTSA
jgi:hypothetical protein